MDGDSASQASAMPPIATNAPMVSVASTTAREIATQPDCWRQMLSRSDEVGSLGHRFVEPVAVVGCGTSLYIGRAMARIAEDAGLGVFDAFPASEIPSRRFGSIIFLSRSGTTTEVLDAARRSEPDTVRLAITTGATPLEEIADHSLVLDFADEKSVVQTRFATTALLAMRMLAGHDLRRAINDAHEALVADLPPGIEISEKLIFLGQGWAAHLAEEAALKMREAAGAFCEAYPAMEFRHGPMSAVTDDTMMWCIGELDAQLDSEISGIGSTVVGGKWDPMAELVMVQRCAESLARNRGRDPDHPPRLSRSVIL